jgi:hypothetical protein
LTPWPGKPTLRFKAGNLTIDLSSHSSGYFQTFERTLIKTGGKKEDGYSQWEFVKLALKSRIGFPHHY